MQQSQFLLVVCSMYQRLLSFRKSYVLCRSKMNATTLGDHLAVLSHKQVETAANHVLNGKQTNNATLKKLFSSIRGHCSSIGHSNEAASVARFKLFSFWHYFGCPAIFFTVTPCDECSFRVRLYATCKEHKLPNIFDISDQSKCLLDFEARKKWRGKYPGACAMEYENIVQIVIRVIIGWNQSEQKGYKGAFGIPLAYGDSCEEQARYTLHSHISVWIENFNIVRNLLFHENEDIRSSAYQRLQTYFEKLPKQALVNYLLQQIMLTQIVLCLTKLMMCYILLMTKS